MAVEEIVKTSTDIVLSIPEALQRLIGWLTSLIDYLTGSIW